jgi:acetylornithine deacetylase
MEAERPPNADTFPAVSFATMNVGTISGGSVANVIPDRCEIQLGIRLLPGMAARAMTERINATVREAVSEPFTLESLTESPAMMLDPGAPILRTLCKATGEPEAYSVMFATDPGWLQSAGFDCVLFGPGSIEVAHQANEFLSADQFRRAGEILDGLIRQECFES